MHFLLKAGKHSCIMTPYFVKVKRPQTVRGLPTLFISVGQTVMKVPETKERDRRF